MTTPATATDLCLCVPQQMHHHPFFVFTYFLWSWNCFPHRKLHPGGSGTQEELWGFSGQMAVISSLGEKHATSEGRITHTPNGVPEERADSGERGDGGLPCPGQLESDCLPSVCLAVLLLLIFCLVSCMFICSDPGSPHVMPQTTKPPRLASTEGHLAHLRLQFPGQKGALWRNLGQATRERPMKGSLLLLASGGSRNTLLHFSQSLVSALGNYAGSVKTVLLRNPLAEHPTSPPRHIATVSVLTESRERAAGGVVVELLRAGEGSAVALASTAAFLPEDFSTQDERRLIKAGIAVAEEFLAAFNHTQQDHSAELEPENTVLIVDPEELPVCVLEAHQRS
ncbi:uncharacterized protein LOC136758594 isoform X2 [Amia ocellicauda]|uniref:uncharacterized protein LOC136758594 isoform X2 n=1 Tax=Amia ocellicauda TaxID=2972642 RepID=UPI003463A44F